MANESGDDQGEVASRTRGGRSRTREERDRALMAAAALANLNADEAEDDDDQDGDEVDKSVASRTRGGRSGTREERDRALMAAAALARLNADEGEDEDGEEVGSRNRGISEASTHEARAPPPKKQRSPGEPHVQLSNGRITGVKGNKTAPKSIDTRVVKEYATPKSKNIFVEVWTREPEEGEVAADYLDQDDSPVKVKTSMISAGLSPHVIMWLKRKHGWESGTLPPYPECVEYKSKWYRRAPDDEQPQPQALFVEKKADGTWDIEGARDRFIKEGIEQAYHDGKFKDENIRYYHNLRTGEVRTVNVWILKNPRDCPRFVKYIGSSKNQHTYLTYIKGLPLLGGKTTINSRRVYFLDQIYTPTGKLHPNHNLTVSHLSYIHEDFKPTNFAFRSITDNIGQEGCPAQDGEDGCGHNVSRGPRCIRPGPSAWGLGVPIRTVEDFDRLVLNNEIEKPQWWPPEHVTHDYVVKLTGTI